VTRWVRLIGWLLATTLCCPAALAQSSVGRSSTGLPGLDRMPIAEAAADPVAAGVALGYARTEPQPGEEGAHHRMLARAAVAVAPLPALQVSLRVDARHDRHPPDSQGGNSGTLLSPTLVARWLEHLGSGLSVGAEAGLWLPGSESSNTRLGSASPHAALFGTWRSGAWALGGLAGYRFDRSAGASPDLARTRAGDRLALGLSDFDAAKVALGAAYLLGMSRLFAELNADLLLGSGAPPSSEHPITASLGARHQLDPAWTLELVATACASQRPALGPNDPLVPVEPRFALVVGTSFRLAAAATPPAAPREAPPSAAPAPAAALASIELTVQLASREAGRVQASLFRGAQRSTLSRQGENQFVLSGVAPGSAELRVSADGYREWTQSVNVPESGVTRLSVQLEPLLQAQIRGLVRSLTGRGLRARILVQPLGIQADTTAEGFFELDVPPGSYSVTIEAEGYAPQQRQVALERDGVVILNADLAKAL
jgi:hypothetical protein